MTQRLQGLSARGQGRGRARPIALLMPPTVRLRVTPEDFERTCRANPDLRLERTARGVLEIMSPTCGGAGARNADLTAQLVVWAKTDGTGTAFDSSTGFTLPSGAVRAPDASWVRNERWNLLTRQQVEEGFAPICPDFVIELRSPSDKRKNKLRRKMRAYITNGTRLGWLIDPYDLNAEIHRVGRPVEVLDRPATLSGEDVLPGFVLDLRGIVFE